MQIKNHRLNVDDNIFNDFVIYISIIPNTFISMFGIA